MSQEYWDLVEATGGGPRIRRTGTAVADIVGRCEAGEAPSAVASAMGLEPVEMITAFAHAALGGDDGGPPLVQARSARPRLESALSEPSLAGLFPHASRPKRLGLAAGLLQIFDFWDASHTAAQAADDQGEAHVSAYWHGIAHRREPDPGNASYWFRRVGRHPLFARLAEASSPLVDDSLASRFLSRGSFDPFAFIELCTRSRGRDAEQARRVQRLEMRLLLGESLPRPSQSS